MFHVSLFLLEYQSSFLFFHPAFSLTCYTLIFWVGRQRESKTWLFYSHLFSWYDVKCKGIICIVVDLGYEGRTGVILLVHNKISNDIEFRMMQGVFTKSQAFIFPSLLALGVREKVGKKKRLFERRGQKSNTFPYLVPKSYKIVRFIQAPQELINNFLLFISKGYSFLTIIKVLQSNLVT